MFHLLLGLPVLVTFGAMALFVLTAPFCVEIFLQVLMCVWTMFVGSPCTRRVGNCGADLLPGLFAGKNSFGGDSPLLGSVFSMPLAGLAGDQPDSKGD
ncbi:MAG: hypothetical protein VB071_10170 [Lawsonibacter sp.]|nr:hypothetical protein [Lawsonibacter sp.]